MDQKYSLQRSAAMLRDSEDDSRYSVSFARTPLFRVMGPVNIVVSRDNERRFKSTVIPEEHDEGGEREEKKGKGKRREAEREREREREKLARLSVHSETKGRGGNSAESGSSKHVTPRKLR